MTFHSVAVLEKPLTHITLSDWHGRVNTIRGVGDARRGDAFNIRHSARTLRNDTRIEAEWTTYDTNVALDNRIVEMNRWRKDMAKMLERILNEIKSLTEEKASTEREQEALKVPIGVLQECLTTRDSRMGSEITYDEADIELKNELTILETNQRLLIEQCQKAWEKLNRLEDVRFRLVLELEDRHDAEKVDSNQLALNKFSSNITYKVNPTRNPRNFCTYEAWREHTRNIQEMVESELAETYATREALFVAREKARNMLRSQQQRSEHVLRRRIFDTQRVRNEIEWQKAKIKDEMSKVLKEIKALEQSLHDKRDVVKLAETRLENRAQRPGLELCFDSVHEQLIKETQNLQNIRQRLINKIEEAKSNYNLLEEHANKIEADLDKKQHSLMTDIRALDLRQRLKCGAFGEPLEDEAFETQTDRNIKLTRMEDEIPRN